MAVAIAVFSEALPLLLLLQALYQIRLCDYHTMANKNQKQTYRLKPRRLNIVSNISRSNHHHSLTQLSSNRRAVTTSSCNRPATKELSPLPHATDQQPKSCWANPHVTTAAKTNPAPITKLLHPEEYWQLKNCRLQTWHLPTSPLTICFDSRKIRDSSSYLNYNIRQHNGILRNQPAPTISMLQKLFLSLLSCSLLFLALADLLCLLRGCWLLVVSLCCCCCWFSNAIFYLTLPYTRNNKKYQKAEQLSIPPASAVPQWDIDFSRRR